MRTLPQTSPATLTAAAISTLAVLAVLVDDSWRTAVITAIAVLVLYASRWRVAPVGAALLATVMAGLAISGHAAANDTRPVAAQLPAAAHAHPAARHHRH
jgi:putative copper export protein